MTTEHTSLYAWVADGEGIVAAHLADEGWVPMVTARRDLAVGLMRELAITAAELEGKTVRLVEYRAGDELMVHVP